MIEDIRYLIVFAKIAEVGSISGGAEALKLTTATASLHLSRLERNLGCALLYRNTRKLSLTHDGASLLETAKSMLELYEKGVIEFKQRSISTRNNLRISIPAVFINSEFTQHIAAFIREHPDVCLSISCSDSRNDIIAEGIDVAFRIGELPDSSLKARHLFLLPRRVIAAREFLAEYEPVRHPRDLEGMRWIGLTMRPNTRRFRHEGSGEEVDIKYSPYLRVDSVEASYRLAQLKVGFAAPPNYLSDDGIRRNEIVAVLPEWTLEPLKVYAVWPANISTSSIAYTLINVIYDSLNSRSLG
ncbi:putative HTH-type transcriptional regulator LtrA [Pseudomonas cichorii]|uniref:Putative HTH-type transcriptional regulator LtrA n=1 Tax=Pseudomonas cichorii TaxID=36746 RepID=A0A3M4LYH6_PSECI|nr:LysR family transcriptional regulator [Pseudomonas cichorii]RMQ46618.1 putative HTH-type transcriptional regulator LtrA [Pseudomonas cichorii]